ncbi:hypothetical protein ES705_47981 [subsurface metagenome]
MYFPIGTSSAEIPGSLRPFLGEMLMHHLLIPAAVLPRMNVSIVVVLAKGQPLLVEIYQVGGSAVYAYAHDRVHI